MICPTCGLVITEVSEVVDGRRVVSQSSHAPHCPETWDSGDSGVEDPDPLAEDYPGQRITGPDYDTRDREGRDCA